MEHVEAAVFKLRPPTRHKRLWLEETAEKYRQAVQIALDHALQHGTTKLSALNEAYRAMRELGLPSAYACAAKVEAAGIMRGWFRKRRRRKDIEPPRFKGGSFRLAGPYWRLDGTNLGLPTGRARGERLWFPLEVPEHRRHLLAQVRGDIRLFKRGEDWYVMMPVRIPIPEPSTEGEPTVIGVDLGVYRLVAAKHPHGVFLVRGKPIWHRREHFARVRQRYQRARRTDRVRAIGHREHLWMTAVNHTISKALVELARRYPNPVLAFEDLKGIRERSRDRGAKFNRLVHTWAYRQLLNFVTYKAAKAGVRVVFVRAAGTSTRCPRCGHVDPANRVSQARFRCTSCGYQGDADIVASLNIAALALEALKQGPRPLARPEEGQVASVGKRPDGVKARSRADPNRELPLWGSACGDHG